MTMTITTIGYGDVSPISSFEVLFMIVVEIMGLTIFSFLMSQLDSLSLNSEAKNLEKETSNQLEEWLFKLDKVRKN
jgi:hypothetical protein